MRYAILFSGMSFRRHVNDLEFCYRTLVDHLGFAAGNIHILNYDGSLRAYGDAENASFEMWPGDGTPYRMVVGAEGTRGAFQQALRVIGEQLTPDDQLFINTTGHGGHHGGECGPDLIVYPHCARYKRRDFCADLTVLPPHRSLVVLMAQCFSGGFSHAVVAASRAATTFIAAATSETRQSFMSFEDGNWNSFQRNWIAALGGRDVDGSTVIARPGSAHNERVSVRAAFDYASTCAGRNPYDSPEFGASSERAGELTLTEGTTTVFVAP